MVQGKLVSISGEARQRLRGLLEFEDTLSQEQIAVLRWRYWSYDDKAIFDEDAVRLVEAMNAMGKDRFLVAASMDILSSRDTIEVFEGLVNKEEIEKFQDSRFSRFGLFNCLIFPADASFVILRTSDAVRTEFAGPDRFIQAVRTAECA